MTLLAHASNLRKVPVLNWTYYGMWLGVDLFMLISGWLLGGQLLREASRGRVDPIRFYVKRWMRTLPPYYAMLVVLYFGSGQFAGPLSWDVILSHATFFQVYLDDNRYMISWSLCVEEHFYLLLPVLIWLLARRPRVSTVLLLVIGAEAISVIGRALTYSPRVDIPYLTHLRWHGLFIGMALAWIQINRGALWKSMGRHVTWLAPVGVLSSFAVMASISAPPNPWMYVGAATVGTWALALVFLPCVHEASPLSRLSFPGLQYLGELTYAIYLTHDVLPRWLIDAGGRVASVGGVAWRLALVMAASVMLHHLVERPALRWREWVLARWRPTVLGVPSPSP